MQKHLVSIFFFVSIIITPLFAFATANDIVGMNRELMQDYSSKSQAAGEVLKGKDTAEWQAAEIDNYLYTSVLSIYYALNQYLLENYQHPDTPQQLMDSGILNPWPGNPFNNWEPITWTPGSTEFSPGNLAIQLCPLDWYSKPNPPRAITYVISIFGPTMDYKPATVQDPKPFEEMSWASELPGAIFSHGFFKGKAKK
jgi:hypothetical protein